ncbi:MAG: prepilin peptidase [Firmicutes bacterium]|nr:prepilin peptidase [Bacillota bacterium]
MNGLLYIFSFTMGLVGGSFLNGVYYRLPRGCSVLRPRSRCPHCGRQLTLLELLPLFSFIGLAGRCRYCRRKISVHYPLVELAGGLLFVTVALRFGSTPATVAGWFFFSLLLVISLIDGKYKQIPNRLVVVGLAGGGLFRLSRMVLPAAGLFPTGAWPGALGGLFVGGGLMLIVFIASRGGMGGGDVKLSGMLGFWIGFPGILMTMFFSFLLGALAGLALILVGRCRFKDSLPFAPFLSLGALVTVFWGDPLLRCYFKLIGW